VEINEELDDSPENLNSDPYGAWIIKVENITEEEDLLDAAAYEAFCAEEG
jgi:glycine cleavage system H protein